MSTSEESPEYRGQPVEFVEGDTAAPLLFREPMTAEPAGEADAYLPDNTSQLPSMQEIAALSRQEMWQRWGRRVFIPAAAVGVALGTYFVGREIKKRYIGGDELFFASSDAHAPMTVATGLRRERGIAASFPKSLKAAKKLLNEPESSAQVFVLFPNEDELKVYPLDGGDDSSRTYLDAAKYFAGKIAQHLNEGGNEVGKTE